MLRLLEEFFCDVCDEVVTVDNGYVIWQLDDERLAFDFKIIHKVLCDDKDYPCSNALSQFLGENGKSYLLSFISVGKLKIILGQKSEPKIKDFDEFVDFFRRVQTPYYEEARKKFGDNNVLIEFYNDASEKYPYFIDALKEIIETES